jgi:hypothetical protein
VFKITFFLFSLSLSLSLSLSFYLFLLPFIIVAVATFSAMLKLFKPKKRLTISDIKIPIPMLAGIENATNLTEEQIDFFLRGGKLNIPVEQQKQQQNISPVILNEKIKPEESSSNSDYSSDSENDPIIIVDFSQKIPTGKIIDRYNVHLYSKKSISNM